MQSLRYVSYHDIDKKKWDECIMLSANKLIYVNSFYLDAMAGEWDALVLNDYDVVMPVLRRKKWGIKYLYQPAFMQQGGLYHKAPLAQDVPFNIYKLLQQHYRFAEIALNYANPRVSFPGVSFSSRNNYILDLHRSYESITAGYAKNVTQELRRLQKFNLNYVVSTDTDEAIEIYRDLYGNEMTYSKRDYLLFQLLCKKLIQEESVLVRHIKNDAGEPLAVALLLKDNRRLYNIISCILPTGKKYSANYFLYDSLIKEFSGKKLLLDFEGSDKVGIKYFYEKFTQANQPYFFMKFNRLPWPLKLFKR
ncbi:MAG: GNAT family N-acetyltransferase [Ferruginibacter sp.]